MPAPVPPNKRVGAALELGIGDDAAIIRPNGRADWVLSCDAFLEGIHFLPDVHPPDSVGYKALARAISDLAAMGARPRFFLMTLALPASRTGAWLDEFVTGLNRASRALGIALIGGDTTRNPLVMVSITVVGEVPRGKALRRGGAHPGDSIFVSGALGRAHLGLELIRKGLGRRRSLKNWLQPHLYPSIRLQLGAWLARNRVASATMDLSDGLSTDLPRLCAASRIGARLWAERIPRVDPTAPALAPIRSFHLDPLAMALHGGEDYELLFTVPPRNLNRLRKAPGFANLTRIGEITKVRSITLVGSNGRSRPLESLGWDPFRQKERKR